VKIPQKEKDHFIHLSKDAIRTAMDRIRIQTVRMTVQTMPRDKAKIQAKLAIISLT
jgi:hypothetical protein